MWLAHPKDSLNGRNGRHGHQYSIVMLPRSFLKAFQMGDKWIISCDRLSL